MSEDLTDPLAALADETRLDILRALADADGPLTFTELYDRTDVRDSGRVGYHLRQLAEFFVRDTAEGYELGHAGKRMLAAGEAAVSDADPAQSIDSCPICGEDDCQRLFHVHLSPDRPHSV